jgi:Fe-S cluster assembly iron-binding protein IscA
MPVTLTPRAIEVLRRAIDAGRLDASSAGVRVWVTRTGDAQIGFADEPTAGDEIVEAGGIRVFVAPGLADAVLDVADEHDRIVVRKT